MIPTIFSQPQIKKAEKLPASSAEGDSVDAEKTWKTGQKDQKGRRKGLAAMTWS